MVRPGMKERPFQCQVVVARPEGQQSMSEEAYQYSVVTMCPAPMLATAINGMCAPLCGRYWGSASRRYAWKYPLMCSV